MTLPWVDPASENDPRAAVGEPGREGNAAPRPSDPVLSDKPVLEWTKEDWARWIDSSSRTSAAEAEPFDVADVTDDATDEAVGPGAAEADGVVEMDERPWNLESGFPIVDIGLPDEEQAHSLVDRDLLWDEQPEQAVKLEAPAPAIANPTPSDPAANELAPPPLILPIRREPLTT
ncbi:MAG: hypothetical protein LC799_04325, partial [Actinobacteria bacterium]|nr:hypothetical protein [Actinomycetota bacterium]